jgi:hypothetical protein
MELPVIAPFARPVAEPVEQLAEEMFTECLNTSQRWLNSGQGYLDARSVMWRRSPSPTISRTHVGVSSVRWLVHTQNVCTANNQHCGSEG